MKWKRERYVETRERERERERVEKENISNTTLWPSSSTAWKKKEEKEKQKWLIQREEEKKSHHEPATLSSLEKWGGRKLGEVRERDSLPEKREWKREERMEIPGKKSQIQTMIKGSSRPSSSRLLLLDEEERKMILNLFIPYVIIESKKHHQVSEDSLSLLKGEKGEWNERES